MSSDLSIIVVEPDRDRALQIVDTLREAGHDRIQVISEVSRLQRQIQSFAPDIVLIDMSNP